MNILTTLVSPGSSATEFIVLWANGLQRQGTLRVRVPESVADAAVVAELGALHHLLVRRAVFGDDRAGRPLSREGITEEELDAGRVQLKVTSGQIRKLMQGASKKLHLVPYAFFLSSRFYGSAVTVSTDKAWVKPRAHEHVEEIAVSGALDDFQDVPSIGKAALSQHALEQLRIRANGLDPSAAWQQLRRILITCSHEVHVDEAKRRRDVDRHGYSGRCLFSPQTGWNVVVTPPKGADRDWPVIATVYYDRRTAQELRPLASAAI